MATSVDEIGSWPDALTAAVGRTGGLLQRVVVLRETRSTQEAARALGVRAGDVIVAGRQSAGHGRLGRAWADTGTQGVAMTVALARAAPERWAVAAAVAVADAIASVVDAPVGIKWPNDIVVDGRKVAGILVQQTDAVALIGIGINVGQEAWPEELAGRAASLRQIGADVDRLALMRGVLAALADAAVSSDETLTRRFAARDVLSGSRGCFWSDGREYEGRVIRVEPMRGLAVQVGDRTVWLRAAWTTVLSAGS